MLDAKIVMDQVFHIERTRINTECELVEILVVNNAM